MSKLTILNVDSLNLVLCTYIHACSVCEWVRVQEPEDGDGERLLPAWTQRPGEAERAGLRRHNSFSSPAPWSQHPGHLPGAHRLRPQWAEPTAHAPARHGDPHRDQGPAPGRLRHLQPGGRQEPSLHQAAGGGRRVCLPRGAHPLPAQQRTSGCGGHRRTQQPEPWSDHHRQCGVRIHTAY